MASFGVKYFHLKIIPIVHTRTRHFYTRTSSKVIVQMDYNIYTYILSSLKQKCSVILEIWSGQALI